MKHLFFCMLLSVLFLGSCKKDSSSDENNFGEQVFLPDSIFRYDHTGSYDRNADSTLYSRLNISYDQRGYVTKRIYFVLNMFIKTWSGTKTEYEFNDSGSPMMESDYAYDSNKQWILNKKLSWTYDSNNRLTKKEIFVYSIDGTIDTGNKNEYVLNGKGFVTNEAVYSWDKSQNKWIVSGKFDYVTNSSGFHVSRDGFKWDKTSGTWVISSKAKFKTDAKGKVTQTVQRSLESDAKWHVDSLLYKYDNSGREISYEYYLDKVDDEDFFIKEKVEHSYDSNGNLLTFKTFAGYGLKPFSMREYQYNAKGDLTYLSFSYSGQSSSLKEEDRVKFSYDVNGKLIYGADYLVSISPQIKMKSAVYFTSKYNKPRSGNMISELWW